MARIRRRGSSTRRKAFASLPSRPLNAYEGRKYFGTSTRSTTTPKRRKTTKPKATPAKKIAPRKQKRRLTRRYYA